VPDDDLPPAACKVNYQVLTTWPGNFQIGIDITNQSSTATNGWNLRWTFANGQTITQLWNGVDTPSGASHAVRNAPHNGSLGAGATTTFGFNGTWNGTNSIPTLTCSSP